MIGVSFKTKSCKLLDGLASRIGGFVRWSKGGVPHIVVDVSASTYSVCYFGKDKFYRVFYPFPGEVQLRLDFFTSGGVVKYFDGLRGQEWVNTLT